MAVDAANGTTNASMTSSVTTGTCTLNNTGIYNWFTTQPVTGAVSCSVYRTTTGTMSVGNIGSVLCGQTFYDTGSTGDGNTAPGTNTTGAISAKGNINAASFQAGGNNAGTSVWSFGGPLSLCSSSVPQPCISPTNAFFLQAHSGSIPTSFGWTAPNAPTAVHSPLIVAGQVGIASQLSYGSLTDSSLATPQLATTNGSSFTSGDLVLATGTTGSLNFTDSGIAVGAAGLDSLTITPATGGNKTVTIAATGTDSSINLLYLTKTSAGVGSHIFQPVGADSTQMFQLKNAAGTIFASFDSSAKQFRIGDLTAPAATLDVAGSFQVNASGTPIKEGAVGLVGAGMPGIIYNTYSGTAVSGGIGPNTMVTSTPSSNPENCGGSTNAGCYRISFYVFQVVAGSGCGANNTNIAAQVIFTDPVTSSTSTTITVAAFLIAGNGTANTAPPPNTGGSGVTLAVGATGAYIFRAKAGSTIQYKTTVTGGSGCSPLPTYYIIPFLEQI